MVDRFLVQSIGLFGSIVSDDYSATSDIDRLGFNQGLQFS